MTFRRTDDLSTAAAEWKGRLAARPKVYRGMEPERARRIWLTTFTDLTALMLTFFVLQFS